MAHDDAYRQAEKTIRKAIKSAVKQLNLSRMGLSEVPESLGQLTQLQSLILSGNALTSLPDSLGCLTKLQSLIVYENRLETLPASIGHLTALRRFHTSDNLLRSLPESFSQLRSLEELHLVKNRLTSLPDWFCQFSLLKMLYVSGNQLTSIPSSLSELPRLKTLSLYDNQLTDLPPALAQLESIEEIDLRGNPLNPELAAAESEGLKAVKRYLNAKAGAQVVLNEAKLILIGEGEVGKSCLLGALRGDEWEEGRPTTHGIEIKPLRVTDRNTGTEITLNGWDFGGQRVYRPTHQLFFSAPAVYLVVWKPREGPQQGFVKEWIKLVKHREPDAQILVVATHGGPGQRQPDIDRQELWDLFGQGTVRDFFLVDSKPGPDGERPGITELQDAIARVAVGLPEIGRTVPAHWQQTRQALQQSRNAYLPLVRVLEICLTRQMDEAEARLFVSISHRLGHLIHYEHDPVLQDIVVLKPDWLATAISLVLDDKQTRDAYGLVSFSRLTQLWDDPTREEDLRYPPELHSVFLRLMERFDLSYRVADLTRNGLPEGSTTLVAQLVPDVRPDGNVDRAWPPFVLSGDEQQVQICRIVEIASGHSATAEGLFYQLIVRLQRFSLGRDNYTESVHWQRGLMLDDDFNGRALLEHVGNDVRISVRAPYPERFLSALTYEVKWLVESFWEGLRCDVMVPCVEPCGRDAPGTGLFEVGKLIESKKSQRPEYPCPVCSEWQDINCLLRNAPAAQPAPTERLFAGFSEVKDELSGVRRLLIVQHGEAMGRFDGLDLGFNAFSAKWMRPLLG